MVKQYYYGVEGQQFSFIQTPKVLVWHIVFTPLSDGAKLLYSIMLDRMSLSKKKGYIDEEDKIYIVFPNKEVMLAMGCSEHKAINLLKELETFGLIQRRRLGQGRPSRIYVCNFAWFVEKYDNENQKEKYPSISSESADLEVMESEEKSFLKKDDVDFKEESVSSELHKMQFKNCTNGSSRTAQMEVQELHKRQFKNCTNDSSRTAQTTVQELHKQQFSKSDINNIVLSTETDYNETIYSQSVSLSDLKITDTKHLTEGQSQDLIRNYVDLTFHPQVIADYSGASNQNSVLELIELVYDVLSCCEPQIKIGKAFKPTEVVQNRFRKLEDFHLAYVLTKLQENPSKINNISAYLRTCLYEAPTVCSNHYDAAVRHDLFG